MNGPTASTSKKKAFGAITSTEVRKVENGFEVHVRDNDYNSKTYVARTQTEANKLIRRYSPKARAR